MNWQNIYALSRNKRRSLIHLAYSVVAKEAPHCEIDQDPLRRRYPDTNYGLVIEFATLEEAEAIGAVVEGAFKRRGYTASCKASKDQDGKICLHISEFYHFW